MNTHLNVYRTTLMEDDPENAQLESFIYELESDGYLDGWTCTKKFKEGDIVLFYFGIPLQSIVAVAIVESVWDDEGEFHWTNKNRVTRATYRPAWLLKNYVSLADAVKKAGFEQWYKGRPYQTSRQLPEEIASALIKEIISQNLYMKEKLRDYMINVPPIRSKIEKSEKQIAIQFEEGAIREITQELQYRNPNLKKKAVQIRGAKCEACGFDYEECYGDIGAGYIEIHHLLPLSQSEKKTISLSIEDVVLVCANCHRMLHHNGIEPIPIKKLQYIVKHQRNV